MVEVKIIADSVNPAGDRITTGVWTYPRYIHSEVMTHRMLAKNAASSRAIPIEKMIAALETNPAAFEQYGAANKTMQAKDMMPEEQIADFLEDWTALAGKACSFADKWKTHTAKQIVNRALEPWMHMTIIITGTDWHNFFSLRAHAAAQPEFQVLAYRWLDAYLKSEPKKCEWGEWHLPLADDPGPLGDFEDLKKISVARCARVSYTRHEQIKTFEEDVALHDRMLESGHWSPFEHQACAMLCGPAGALWPTGQGDHPDYASLHYSGCYRGWKPYRKFLPNENRTNVNLHKILANKPSWITLFPDAAKVLEEQKLRLKKEHDSLNS